MTGGQFGIFRTKQEHRSFRYQLPANSSFRQGQPIGATCSPKPGSYETLDSGLVQIKFCSIACSTCRGFSHFVTSMTAPIASGWSDCRVGLAPTGKRRLCTAHANSGHSRSRSRRLRTGRQSGRGGTYRRPSRGAGQSR
jgi:hypothetical protein